MRSNYTHAPYPILGDLVIAYAATTKTACGKRRKTTSLVSRSEATCPECIAELKAMQQAARDLGL